MPGGPASERVLRVRNAAAVLGDGVVPCSVVAALLAAARGLSISCGCARSARGSRLVLEERARLAREIHDTLAQGFVGISSQLDAVAMCMPKEATPARTYLDMARRMARHSLTEARR